jgi:hypothetical protein
MAFPLVKPTTQLRRIRHPVLVAVRPTRPYFVAGHDSRCGLWSPSLKSARREGDPRHAYCSPLANDHNRRVSTGNRYKELLQGLMQKGVQLELCGATAKANHWTNDNLLPGVKVNVNAMVRLTQLEQRGYTMIYQ